MNELINELYELHRRIINLTHIELSDKRFIQFLCNKINFTLGSVNSVIKNIDAVTNGKISMEDYSYFCEMAAVYKKPLIKFLEDYQNG